MTPEDLDPVASLEAIAVEVTHITHNVHHAGEYLLVLNPLVAQSLADHGWERGDIRYHLYENARVPMEEFRRMQERRGVTNPNNKARWPKWLESAGPGDAGARHPPRRRPGDHRSRRHAVDVERAARGLGQLRRLGGDAAGVGVGARRASDIECLTGGWRGLRGRIVES